jgi:excisionase family DNA binding protein
MIAHDNDYLTVREAAALLRVSVPTIRRWIAAGRLHAVRWGGRTVRLRCSDVRGAAAEPVTGVDDWRRYILPRPPATKSEEESMAEIEEVNRAILARRGGRPLPSSVPLIRQARRERARHL